MIETFIIIVLAYTFIVLPLIFKNEIWNHFFGQKSDTPKDVPRRIVEDIIVKSKTSIGQIYAPLDNDTPKEKPIDNQPNLAPENKKSISAKIPTERLDEVFSNNEKLDIDVAMEVEDDNLDDDVEAEELITLTGGLASGVSVEQMGLVVKTLSKPSPTPKEQDETAEVIEKVHATEMMQQIIDSIPNADLRIKQILMECEQRIEKSRPKSKIAKGNQVPDNFRLEDYIN